MGDGYFDRLATDPPAMWSLGWVADYPGRNDFLGVLLGTAARPTTTATGARPSFDAAIAEAVSAADPAAAAAAYDRAEAIVRDEVPVVPVAYGPGWALLADGLLGAGAERARDRPDGGTGVGRLMRAVAAGRRLVAYVAGLSVALWLGLAAPSAPRRPTGPTSGTPTADVHVRRAASTSASR